MITKEAALRGIKFTTAEIKKIDRQGGGPVAERYRAVREQLVEGAKNLEAKEDEILSSLRGGRKND